MNSERDPSPCGNRDLPAGAIPKDQAGLCDGKGSRILPSRSECEVRARNSIVEEREAADLIVARVSLDEVAAWLQRGSGTHSYHSPLSL